MRRYYNSAFEEEFARLRKLKQTKYLHLIKALKHSKTPADIEPKIAFANSKCEDEYEEEFEDEGLMGDNMLERQIEDMDRRIGEVLKDVTVEIAEHHHLYLSTILEEIAQTKQKHTQLYKTELMQAKEGLVLRLVNQFRAFFKRAMLQQAS